MTECCKNCKHCIRVGQLADEDWHWYRMCDVFVHDANGYGIIVADNDRCELYEVKE